MKTVQKENDHGQNCVESSQDPAHEDLYGSTPEHSRQARLYLLCCVLYPSSVRLTSCSQDGSTRRGCLSRSEDVCVDPQTCSFHGYHKHDRCLVGAGKLSYTAVYWSAIILPTSTCAQEVTLTPKSLIINIETTYIVATCSRQPVDVVLKGSANLCMYALST